MKTLQEHRAEAERHAIRKALQETDGHREDAADLLGISWRTLYRKLARYGSNLGFGGLDAPDGRGLLADGPEDARE